ncbi:cytochrome P450 [Aspergillus californicus]
MLLVLALVAILYLLYTTTAIIQCLYYHPLSHIPGPKLWIAFPLLRHISSVRGRFDIDLRAFHRTYGEAVRFAANEVSFITAQAWKDIYGHGHLQLPKALHSQADPLNIFESNDADHSRYRKALSHAFSAKGLLAQEPVLKDYIDLLITKLKDAAESESMVDMVKWYNITTFDLIGDLVFGQSSGGLESSEYHIWVTTAFRFLRVLPFIRMWDVYPLVKHLAGLFMPKSLVALRVHQLEFLKTSVEKRLARPNQRGHADFMDSMLRHRGEKDGLSLKELISNSSALIFAGSETSATLLSGVTFLLKNPATWRKLSDEVRSVMQCEGDITFSNATANLPYMLGCIEEALRRYPPVPSGFQRITTSPSVISGYQISQNTKVSVHQSAAYYSPLNFHQPERFIPERWLPEATTDPQSPFFNDKRDVLQPFSVGPRNCIGRNLAYNEIRLILARVIWAFDLELSPESQAWDDQKSYILWDKPPLM